jgi:hypothetical protein
MLSIAYAMRVLLPFELDDRLVPVYLIAVCLVTLYLPEVACIAAASAALLAYVMPRLRLYMTGHEPFVYPTVRLPSLPRRTVEHVYKAEEPEAPEETPPSPRKYIPEL